MFRRTIDLLGEEGHRRLRSSFVAVVGLGGVGYYDASDFVHVDTGRVRRW